MRHFRSILYALVLAPAAWGLVAVGLTRDLTTRGHGGFAVESVTGLLLLLLGGAAYAILLLAPISPAGPGLAGLAFLGATGWALESPSTYADIWLPVSTDPRFDLSRPGYGLAALLSVPLLVTTLSARRWTRYEPPVLPIVGQIGRARGAASVAGTPVAALETAKLPSTPPDWWTASDTYPEPTVRQAAVATVPTGAADEEATRDVSRVQAGGRDEPTVDCGESEPTVALADPAEEPTVAQAAEEPTDALAAEEPTVAQAAEEPTDALVADSAEGEPTAVTVMLGEEPTAVTIALDEEPTPVTVAIDEEPTAVTIAIDEEPTPVTVAIDEEPTVVTVPADEEPTTVMVVRREETTTVIIARDRRSTVADPTEDQTTVISLTAIPPAGEPTQVIRRSSERVGEERTQVIRVAEPTAERTRVIRPVGSATAGERTEPPTRAATKPAAPVSIAGAEAPAFAEDPTGRIPVPTAQPDEAERTMTVMSLERPPDDIPAQRPPAED